MESIMLILIAIVLRAAQMMLEGYVCACIYEWHFVAVYGLRSVPVWVFMALILMVACMVPHPEVSKGRALERLSESFARPLWILALAYGLRWVH